MQRFRISFVFMIVSSVRICNLCLEKTNGCADEVRFRTLSWKKYIAEITHVADLVQVEHLLSRGG